MSKIKKIYDILLKNYGPQKWWPVTSESEITPRYSGGPKTGKQQLEVIFGAILTQNTSWKNVEKAIINLNKNNLIDIKKIIEIENKKLANIIKSSGYHNQKAERLKIFSEFLLKNYNGNLKKLFEKNIDELRKELLEIKGIGPETADSIILYSAQKPIFVIDAYTKRIFSRIGFKEKTYDEFQNAFHKNLAKDVNLFNEYHALIVEHGKNICKKKPLCSECVISEICQSNNKLIP